MTVLIATAGADGRAARDRLAAAGFDVEHVTTLSAARDRAAAADVVVAGGLADATVDDLRAVLQARRAGTPLVHLDADEAFDADALPAAVRRAERTGRYRRAVDDFYERCRERALSGERADGEAVMAAKRRAEREFHETRRLDGGLSNDRPFAFVPAVDDGWLDALDDDPAASNDPAGDAGDGDTGDRDGQT